MRFMTVLLSAAAAATAASIPRQYDSELIDFTTWGLMGCDDDYNGYFTYNQSAANTCIEKDDILEVQSLFVQEVSTSSCSFYVYQDTICAVEAIPVPLNECFNIIGFGAFKIVCP
ncbi:hypothetical protein M406DRAFT_70095 [Cryphonectria parasitica EP155]|uniref:Uncharacterized protein n=1 Tax=Cryphonectria parasitica (strain ATCC 38755 / EP155) TaxID=660469 RepID=A0A9P4Y7J2_CRYP1|nr:uncharacterized protein M406DRAFT_70095 [Cryphonectria parasitica EP155]KAF3767993.1 hypothetical protein M406DRAFT_70095 [Cryphonectria parasitica EP155]